MLILFHEIDSIAVISLRLGHLKNSSVNIRNQEKTEDLQHLFRFHVSFTQLCLINRLKTIS